MLVVSEVERASIRPYKQWRLRGELEHEGRRSEVGGLQRPNDIKHGLSSSFRRLGPSVHLRVSQRNPGMHCQHSESFNIRFTKRPLPRAGGRIAGCARALVDCLQDAHNDSLCV